MERSVCPPETEMGREIYPGITRVGTKISQFYERAVVEGGFFYVHPVPREGEAESVPGRFEATRAFV